MIPREIKVYFIAVALIFLSFVALYHEMVKMHEVAHQKALQYFGINSSVVFYSPFEAATIANPSNLTAADNRFLYFIQSLNEVFEYQFLAEMAFIFLAMLIIVTTVFILVAPKKREES